MWFGVGDLQTTFTMNGVLLIISAKTPMGMQVITHYPVALAQSLPRLVLVQIAHANFGDLLLRWNPFFRSIYGDMFTTRLRQHLSVAEPD